MSFFCIILRLGTKPAWDQEIVLTSVAKAIQGPSLSFECIDNIGGKNCFPLGVLRVSHRIPHHVLQEDSQHSSHLKIAILDEYSSTTYLREKELIITRNQDNWACL